MLQEDTTFVPFFKRGYSTNMTVLKNRANVVSQLDANRDRLRARLAVNPRLINAQFVPLAFASWNDLTQTVDLFIRAGGDPRAASSQVQANAIAFLAAYFPTAADESVAGHAILPVTDAISSAQKPKAVDACKHRSEAKGVWALTNQPVSRGILDGLILF